MYAYASGEEFYRELSRWENGAKQASELLLAHGIKGIKYLDGASRGKGEGSYNYVIFSGDDVKITGVNESGKFKSMWEDYTDTTATFSMERNLAAVHTLSAKKFLDALELGGMPLPSVAVTRLDKPYSWGGADGIALVGRPELVDPRRGTEVYSADAWTGKFPRVVHKHIENADFKEAAKAAGKLEDKYGYVFYELANMLRQADTRSDLEYLLSTDTGKALFACMQGYEPKAKTVEKPMDYQFLDKQFAKDTRNMWENGDAIKEGQELAFADAVEASLERWLAANKDAKMLALYRKLYSDLLSDLRRGRPYGVWFKLKMSLNNMGKRELDAHGNREMLAKYADKHKKAFAAWVQEKVDKWRSKEGYIRENGKEATLDNVVNYMLSKKGLNNEEFMGFSPGKLRAALSAKMRSLDDIKARRERLGDSAESKASKEPSEQLMMEYCRFVREHLQEADADSFYAMDYGLESLSLVKGKPTEEKVARAVRKVFSYTKAGDAMAQDEELLLKGVEAVESVRREVEDYMEAVPQRAVKMAEWEYAVMPEELKKNKAVMAGLREHGIKPRFHDGTEEGRKAALAGLVNDSRVSFSVIGPKAATWDKYADRAFKGRDDGLLRAEIDASNAKLKWEDLRGRNVAAYRRIVDDWYKLPDEECKTITEYAELYYDWQDELAKLNSTSEEDAAYFDVYKAVAKLRSELNEKRGGVRKLLGEWFVERGGGAAVMISANDALVDAVAASLWGPYVDYNVEDELDLQPLWHGGMALQDVLAYDEMYAAYPELAQLRVETVKMEGGALGRVVSSAGQHIIQINKNLEGEWAQFFSTLMHEVQHVIQDIEGFAKGGNPQSARDAAGNYKRRYEIQNECARLRQNIAWLEGYDVARREFLNIGDAISMREDKEKLQDLRDKYNNLAYQYNKGAIVEPGYNGEDGRDSSFVIPSLSGVTKGAYAKAQKAWDITQDRKAAFPGMLERLRARYDVLWAEFSELDKQQQRWGALSSHELYLRLAGEIEARNVQQRVRMTADERLAMPFNETLEYPGEALVTFSMERASLQALDVLRTRADEREGERLMNDWQKACEGWAQLHVGGDDSRLGNGAKMLGEIHALIGATKGVLPEKYARMGHLNGLLRWAAVYANMQQTGDVPAEGVIAGPIYEKFVERMRYVDAKNEAYGLNEAEVKEAMALLAGERLDVAMLKVARECKRRLEVFLKDRERERIDWVVERAYPKREKGKRTPRGKMDAETYRRMERAYRLMEMEANEVAGMMNLIKSALDKMNDEPAEAVTVLRVVRGGDVPGVDEVEALEAELEDELFLAQTFGCWENMAFEQARRASGAMAELVLLGRNVWQSKLRAERRRAAFDRDEVSRHFGTKLEDVQAVRGDKTAKEKGRKRTSAKNLVMGSMSYSQLLVALEEKLGKRFTGRHMRMIAEAHEKIMMENQRRHRWMYNTLRDITGLETEGEIEEWMQKNNEIIDTGIDLDMPMKTTCRLTPEEAKMWLSLTAEERQKKRDEMGAEAAKKGEKPDNIPGEDVMAELEERLMEAEQADAMPKEFVFTTEWSYKSRLKCTREALLYAILTFEQEDYEHLLEANGLTQAKLQQMRKLVGKELLRWGYAMRSELSEHGKMVAELYEAYTGVPFGQRQNYFRGVFDVARAKDAGEAVDQVSGVTGGKYGILIARQYHNQQLNWSTSASLVFVATMKEQQNYIATAHITREWRTLLSDRLFERRVRAEIGDAALDMLTGWMKMIEGAALADVKVNAMMNNMLSKLAKAYAVSRLAGNAYTIMKQASALLNGFVGGYVPERVLAGNELVQELTYRHVGFGGYMAALGKAMAGKTEITMKELEAAGFIAGRKNVEGSHIEEAALLSPWQKVPGKVGRKGRALYEANMEAIGYVDRKANAKAALAIAEVVYQQAKKENADGLVPDAELRRVALETARMMVDRAAQPQLRTQKGFLAAGGGAFGAIGNFFYMFKSETLNKLGLYVAQMMAGQHRAWLVGALSFGVMNSVVLALIDWICGRWYDDDDEKWEKRAKSFAGNVLFNDISTVPLLGEIPDWVRGKLLGERYWASNSLVSWGTDTWKYGAREWKNIDEGASWDKHVTALCSLARSVGALGGMGLSGHNAAVGSCCELTLAAASLSNTVRFVKDVVKKVVGE